jgi:hypothetical protein
LAKAREHLGAVNRKRFLRRPDPAAVSDADDRLRSIERHLNQLGRKRTGVAERVRASLRTAHDAKVAIGRIPELESEVAKRKEWLHSHPAELAWEADLGRRVAECEAELGQDVGHERPSARQDNQTPDDDVLKRIDLRTIDLGSAERSALHNRDGSRVCGLNRGRDVPARPLPGQDLGIDVGPDLGL